VSYDPREQQIVLETFGRMLAGVTRDGGRKRMSGEKPPWWRDPSHEAAIFSHLNKWKHGEKFDEDSGAHPLVHLAWRALAIAWIETHGEFPPPMEPESLAARVCREARERLDRQAEVLRAEIVEGPPHSPHRNPCALDPDPDASDPCGRPDCEAVRVEYRDGLGRPVAGFVRPLTSGSSAAGADELDRLRGRA
jgi:hypothetical protein